MDECCTGTYEGGGSQKGEVLRVPSVKLNWAAVHNEFLFFFS